MTLDWGLACRNLNRTLEALRRQTCPDFRVLVACHEIPDVDTSGLDIEFVMADFDPPAAIDEKGQPGNDKPAKKRLLGMAMKASMGEASYFMHLDADDLVHPTLVEATLSDDNRLGYLIERGYMLDCASGLVGRMDATFSEFWRHCGSCAVIHLTRDDLPAKLSDNICYFTQFKKHAEYANTAADHGRPLSTYPQPMAIYLVNHGENDVSAYRGKIDVKSKYVSRAQITDEEELARIIHHFPMLAGFVKR